MAFQTVLTNRSGFKSFFFFLASRLLRRKIPQSGHLMTSKRFWMQSIPNTVRSFLLCVQSESLIVFGPPTIAGCGCDNYLSPRCQGDDCTMVQDQDWKDSRHYIENQNNRHFGQQECQLLRLSLECNLQRVSYNLKNKSPFWHHIENEKGNGSGDFICFRVTQLFLWSNIKCTYQLLKEM